MANKRKHLIAGSLSGITVSTYIARDQDLDNSFIEIFGGGIGGIFGSRIPDWKEPSLNNPRHRSIAHSYSTAAFLLEFVHQNASTWQRYCRQKAEWHERLQLENSDGWLIFWHSLMSFFWRFLSGFSVGVIAGYLSHLLLDVGTPRSLPLFA